MGDTSDWGEVTGLACGGCGHVDGVRQQTERAAQKCLSTEVMTATCSESLHSWFCRDSCDLELTQHSFSLTFYQDISAGSGGEESEFSVGF